MEGPSNQGAALVMANCTAMWDQVNDLHFSNSEAQLVVDGMDVWRRALLQHTATSSQSPQTLIAVLPTVLQPTKRLGQGHALVAAGGLTGW